MNMRKKILNQPKSKIRTLITGANRGIGKSIAEEFAKQGSDLYLLIRKKRDYKSLKQLEKKYNIGVNIFIGDLKNLNFIKSLNKKIPYVHNLVNNAAMANTKFFLNVKSDELNDLINVNLRAIFLLSQIFSKKMIKKNKRNNN